MTEGTAGFSLVELLVAVAALAVLASAAALGIAPRAGGGAADADRFLAAARLQMEEAVHGGAPRALVLTATGLAPEMHQGDGWKPAGPAIDWQGEVAWPQEAAGGLRILFWPSGQVSDFVVAFEQAGRSWRCAPVAGQVPACTVQP